MDRNPTGRTAPYISLLVSALGAFIFFGILSGIIPTGGDTLQVATPPTDIIQH